MTVLNKQVLNTLVFETRRSFPNSGTYSYILYLQCGNGPAVCSPFCRCRWEGGGEQTSTPSKGTGFCLFDLVVVFLSISGAVEERSNNFLDDI